MILLYYHFNKVLEKMFAANAKSGVIATGVVPNLLKEFNSEISVVPEEFGAQVPDIIEAQGEYLYL